MLDIRGIIYVLRLITGASHIDAAGALPYYTHGPLYRPVMSLSNLHSTIGRAALCPPNMEDMMEQEKPVTTFTCQYCGKDAPIKKFRGQSTMRTKFCSRACCAANSREKLIEINHRLPDMKIATGTLGAISELVVSIDLMRKGYHVFRAMSPNCPCDLIAMLNGKVLRIEVRTAVINVGGGINYPKNTLASHEYDILALVLRGTEVQYIPEF